MMILITKSGRLWMTFLAKRVEILFMVFGLIRTVEPQYMTTLGKSVWNSEKFGILKSVLFLWAMCDIHDYYFNKVLRVRYTETFVIVGFIM